MATIKVCKYFIKSSPVGELDEVLEDIGKVLGNRDFQSAPEIKEALREYYETHKMILRFPSGETALVSAHGRQEPIVRYSQVAQQVPVQQQPKKPSLFEGDDDDYGAEQEQQPEPEQ